MIITDLMTREINGEAELSALVRAETARKGEFRVWFRVPADLAPAQIVGDPFLAGFLVPCMWSGESLRIEAPLSRRLLETAPAIQAFIRNWYPDFSEIEVSSSGAHAALPVKGSPSNGGAGKEGSFFSGGVDSWYTLLKHRERIGAMVLVQGFDIQRYEEDLWTVTRRLAEASARDVGKRLVAVRTNLKNAADPRKASWGRPYKGRFWGYCYQGSALAAVALCLQETLPTMYIPASHFMNNPIPYGTDPRLDPLWSSENLEIVHDGYEADRLGKIRSQIAGSSAALRNLRVCLANVPGRYNCCRCEKCLRTMLTLHLCGVLGQAPTFDRPLRPRDIARIATSADHHPHYDVLLTAAREAGDSEYIRALEVLLGRRFSPQRYWGMARGSMARAALRVAPRRLIHWLKQFV